jgi:hypothetical protein
VEAQKMGSFGKLKETLEWVEHGRTLVEGCLLIISALGGGTLIRAWLLQKAHFDTVWITPIWLLSTALILFVTLKIWGRKSKNQQQLPASLVPQSNSSAEPQIDPDEIFAASYNSTLLPEVQSRIKAMIDSRPRPERDAFVIKFIAVGLLAYVYDTVWWVIYRSQLLALQELNRRMLSRAELKEFHDLAAKQFPKTYSMYSFEQWTEYLRVNLLITETQHEIFAITLRGKDFLKYLVHWGKTPDQKIN